MDFFLPARAIVKSIKGPEFSPCQWPHSTYRALSKNAIPTNDFRAKPNDSLRLLLGHLAFGKGPCSDGCDSHNACSCDLCYGVWPHTSLHLEHGLKQYGLTLKRPARFERASSGVTELHRVPRDAYLLSSLVRVGNPWSLDLGSWPPGELHPVPALPALKQKCQQV